LIQQCDILSPDPSQKKASLEAMLMVSKDSLVKSQMTITGEVSLEKDD
jgi:hypothetical protein